MNSDVVTLQNATNLSTPLKPGSQAMGKNEFLKLLMTQLSQQDPLNPTDSTEFVSQLSQFSSLEGITNIGTKMDDLLKLTGANNSSSAVSLLGKEVQVMTNAISGPTEVQYNLSNNASRVRLSLRDSNGSVVKVLSDLETSKGLHSVKIEGIEKGKYTFTIEAEDSAQQEISSQLSHTEKVSGVNFSGAIPMFLTESGNQVKATDVVEIRLPTANLAGS